MEELIRGFLSLFDLLSESLKWRCLSSSLMGKHLCFSLCVVFSLVGFTNSNSCISEGDTEAHAHTKRRKGRKFSSCWEPKSELHSHKYAVTPTLSTGACWWKQTKKSISFREINFKKLKELKFSLFEIPRAEENLCLCSPQQISVVERQIPTFNVIWSVCVLFHYLVSGLSWNQERSALPGWWMSTVRFGHCVWNNQPCQPTTHNQHTISCVIIQLNNASTLPYMCLWAYFKSTTGFTMEM